MIKPNIHPPLLLASSSAYRRQLLEKLGIAFSYAAPEIDETPLADETAPAIAQRLAENKARALAEQFPEHLIIGSDQVATVNGQLLGKPGGKDACIAQLLLANGQAVQFYTGLYVWNAREQRGSAELDLTTVQFRQLSREQICAYVEREQPYDCAGGFKSESLGIALFERIDTEDPNALIGLPLIRLIRLLEQFGVDVLTNNP